jgi:hypothetical protein
MKKTLLFIAILFVCRSGIHAQVTLPYYSGFDSNDQKNGWEEYKTAATEFSHWTYAGFGAFSDPNYVGHDYSPSTGITLTDNWFVSPGFSIAGGGKLDSIRYMFSGFSMPADGDTVGIYLLTGAKDPATATKTLLFDFRGSEYMADNTYRVKTNLTLPAAGGLSYLAIRYRNTDCSSKWLTVAFDNIAISGTGAVGLNEAKQNNEEEVSIYPNPTGGSMNISYSGSVSSIRVLNELGQAVQLYSNLENTFQKEISLSGNVKGIYFIEIRDAEKTLIRKIVKQ